MGERITNFEDLITWQKARVLTKDIYSVTADGAFSRDFGLRDQIRRAAVSVLSNIAEGHERASNPEFCRFLSMAKGSCAELRAQLYIAFDTGSIKSETFVLLKTKAEEVSRLIGGLRASVKRKKSQTE